MIILRFLNLDDLVQEVSNKQCLGSCMMCSSSILFLVNDWRTHYYQLLGNIQLLTLQSVKVGHVCKPESFYAYMRTYLFYPLSVKIKARERLQQG